MRTVPLNCLSDKALDFVRIAKCSALAGEEVESAAALAVHRYGEKSLAARVFSNGGLIELYRMKSEVAAGATVSGNWAELIADAESATTAFFAFVRERALIGRIAGFRTVPLNLRLLKMATGIAAEWIGEGQAVPMGSATFAEDSLPARKVASMTVTTKELLRSNDPIAEILLRDEMAASVAAALDLTFLDPANDGVTGVKPASITNAATAIPSTGDGLADVRALVKDFAGDLQRAILIGHPESFAALHDPKVLPDIGVRGGNVLGIPAFPSKSALDSLVLIDPALIAIGTGAIEIRTSTQGSIQMDTDPTQSGVADVTATQMVGLWQNGLAAMMAMVTANWETAVPHVRVIEGVLPS